MNNDIKNDFFQEWLNEYNPHIDNDPDVKTKLMKYYNSILKIVEGNKKEFKNELASMIYRLSYAKT